MVAVGVVIAVVVLAGCVSGIGPQQDQQAGEEAPYVIVTETVWGHENAPEGKTCVQTNQFKHDQMVVFLIKVIDPQTGEPVDNTAIDDVTVEIEGGPSLPAEFGPHPEDNPVDHFWAVSWVVPPEYPAGTAEVTITVEDGRPATHPTFGTQKLTILEGSASSNE